MVRAYYWWRYGTVRQGGFTLVELLVVVVMLGTLAVLTLPSFLSQAAKAQQAEAKSALNSWTKAQRIFREHYGRYASFQELALGLPTDTKHYNYIGNGGQEDLAEDYVRLMAFSKKADLKRYAAGVERDVVTVSLPNHYTDQHLQDAAVLCESHAPGQGLADRPLVNGNGDGVWPTCPDGYSSLFGP